MDITRDFGSRNPGSNPGERTIHKCLTLGNILKSFSYEFYGNNLSEFFNKCYDIFKVGYHFKSLLI